MGGNPEMISASRGIPGDLSQAARWAETIVIVTALATVPDASGRTVAALSNGSRRFPTGHNPSERRLNSMIPIPMVPEGSRGFSTVLIYHSLSPCPSQFLR